VRRVLNPAAVRRALESAYRDLASGEAVCARHRHPHPDARSREVLPMGHHGRRSNRRLFAIRMKSDVVYEREYEGVRTQEKYCSRPGRYCGLVS